MEQIPNMYYKHEVAKHNKANDCWVIINDNVYDLTHFLPEHPGGKRAILAYASKDATEEFEMIHPYNVISTYIPEEMCLGKVIVSKM